jgi:hypothetical protein
VGGEAEGRCEVAIQGGKRAQEKRQSSLIGIDQQAPPGRAGLRSRLTNLIRISSWMCRTTLWPESVPNVREGFIAEQPCRGLPLSPADYCLRS